MQFLPPTVAAMVELQLLTGMRSGELCQMRPCDINMTGPIWLYRPATHKTAIHGHKRVVPIGPRGQEVLRPFLSRDIEACCFAPVEAQEQRNVEKRRLRRSKVQPSQVDRSRPDARPLGERYDTHAYRRAIDYAVKVTNKAIRRQAEAEGREVSETELVPAWHPHQLRHTAATVIRREMGLDAARALLGHRSLGITDTYAELDQALAVEAARKLG
jgi:integrase